MNSPNWGRFTVRGSELLEEKIYSLVLKITTLISKNVPPETYRALIILGGYGRGEGGVEWIEGEEHPHNNIDLLLITKENSKQAQLLLKQKIDQEIKTIQITSPIGIDFSLISEKKLKRSPCLVIWYDMRYGHKTILGDPQFVPTLQQFCVERILPSDIRNLLVNRGSLFLINELLITQKEELTLSNKKYCIRHMMKAIIGYGDALLFFLGKYHWSYLEKLARVQNCAQISSHFCHLYQEALEFRFAPNYQPFLERNILSWMRTLYPLLSKIHLQTESFRLKVSLTNWEEYPEIALTHFLQENNRDFRSWLKKFYYLYSTKHPSLPLKSWKGRMGFLFSGMRERMYLAFPFVCYETTLSPEELFWGNAILGKNNPSSSSIKCYLHQWAMYGDANFPSVLQKLQLTLED